MKVYFEVLYAGGFVLFVSEQEEVVGVRKIAWYGSWMEVYKSINESAREADLEEAGLVLYIL